MYKANTTNKKLGARGQYYWSYFLCNSLWRLYMHVSLIQANFDISNSKGSGENTLSFPKFEIANYDVTQIHVHEQKCVHFCLNRLSSFGKIGIGTKRLYVCNPLCTAHSFLPTIIGVRLWAG